jgi:hypothetical protein
MLDSLLRGVRREIGRGNGHGQADPGYQFCYDGAGGMCAECPVEHNRKACRLSEGEQLERWIAWHVDRMLTDPVGWEDLAVYNVTLPDPNPGALMLFVMCYDMAQDTDNEAMLDARPHFERVLRLLDSAHVVNLAEKARRWHEASPGRHDWRDTCEAPGAHRRAERGPTPGGTAGGPDGRRHGEPHARTAHVRVGPGDRQACRRRKGMSIQ